MAVSAGPASPRASGQYIPRPKRERTRIVALRVFDPPRPIGNTRGTLVSTGLCVAELLPRSAWVNRT